MTVTVRLSGGLGNQLFQYAAGLSLSQHHSVPLNFDLSWFTHKSPLDTPREYSLYKFFPELDLLPVHSSKYCHLLQKFRNLNRFVRDTKLSCPYDLFSSSSNSFLSGYWQTYVYPELVRDSFLQSLSSLSLSSTSSLSILRQILSSNTSISLHVRRGDYISSSHTNSFHGSLTKDYYRSALGLFLERITNPFVVIFSDDIPWCRHHLLDLLEPVNHCFSCPSNSNQ